MAGQSSFLRKGIRKKDPGLFRSKQGESVLPRANRFDLAEALLEIGLVITSVTLLTRTRIYWYLGLIFAAGGILSALSVALLK